MLERGPSRCDRGHQSDGIQAVGGQRGLAPRHAEAHGAEQGLALPKILRGQVGRTDATPSQIRQQRTQPGTQCQGRPRWTAGCADRGVGGEKALRRDRAEGPGAAWLPDPRGMLRPGVGPQFPAAGALHAALGGGAGRGPVAVRLPETGGAQVRLPGPEQRRRREIHEELLPDSQGDQPPERDAVATLSGRDHLRAAAGKNPAPEQALPDQERFYRGEKPRGLQALPVRPARDLPAVATESRHQGRQSQHGAAHPGVPGSHRRQVPGGHQKPEPVPGDHPPAAPGGT